jgi:hypothetical protein
VWIFSASIACFAAVIMIGAGVLACFVSRFLYPPSQYAAHPRYQKGAAIGWGCGGAVEGILTALISLAFWFLYGTGSVSALWTVFHVVVVASISVLGVWVGRWLGMRLLKER